MNFEDHFLPNDVASAKLAFNNLITSLKLIDSYSRKGDKANVERISANLTNALSDLNELACRKGDNQDMYLHNLMAKPQRWYPQ